MGFLTPILRTARTLAYRGPTSTDIRPRHMVEPGAADGIGTLLRPLAPE